MKRLITGVILIIFTTVFCAADITGNILVSEKHGLLTFFEEGDDNYIVSIDPESGEVNQYWDADSFYQNNLLRTIDNDIILRSRGSSYSGNTIYRYTLPEDSESDPERLWKINGVSPESVYTENVLYTIYRNRTVITYSLETGEEISRYSPEDGQCLGFHAGGFYTNRDDNETLVSHDFEANQIWEADIERITFDYIRFVDGYILLINLSTREVFCIDDEGNKLWRQQYPDLYVNFAEIYYRVGGTIVIADRNYTTYIDAGDGHIILNTGPGIEKMSAVVFEDLLIKVPSLSNYYSYGPPGNPVEIFDTKAMQYRGLIMTPEKLAESEYISPAIHHGNRLIFLPLQQNRLTGIDIDSGEITRDFTIILFEDDSSW